MTASRADVQAKIDSALTKIVGATAMQAYVKQYGSDPSNWPTGTNMGAAAQLLLAAKSEVGQLVDATPTPAPPPTPTPTPASGAWAWDAKKATVASDSAARIAAFLRYGGPFAFFTPEVGVGTVTSHSSGVYAVSTDGKPGGPFDPIIYFPDGIQPGFETDGHLAIDDRVTGRWHDFEMFHHAGFVNGKVESWTGGDSMPAGSVQEPPGGGAHGGATVARLPLLQGLITLEEVKAGVINHALVYTMTNCGPGLPPYPSGQKARYTSPNVPMPLDVWQLMPVPGTWLALDPAADLSLVTGFERTVAVALQQYGMFCRDRGTDVSLHGADPGGGGTSYAAWRNLGVALSPNGASKFSAAFIALLKQHLRVLNPPAAA